MIVRKFWLPTVSETDKLPTEYVVDTGSDVLEPVGDVYAEQMGVDDQEKSAQVKKELLDLQTHTRANELVLCASLCNVATYALSPIAGSSRH